MLFNLNKGALNKDYFEKLYPEIKNKVAYATKNRKSCIFTLHNLDLLDESYTNKYNYLQVPQILEEIRTKVELLTGQIYDYVLVHEYCNGEASIAYHRDSEAISSFIASVSLGQSRKFRLREIGKTKGYDYEFVLDSGDVFVMNVGCQSKYLHSVPVEKTIKGVRINLTFRQYEI